MQAVTTDPTINGLYIGYKDINPPHQWYPLALLTWGKSEYCLEITQSGFKILDRYPGYWMAFPPECRTDGVYRGKHLPATIDKRMPSGRNDERENFKFFNLEYQQLDGGEEFVDLGMLDKFWMSTPELGLAVFKADSPMGTTAWSEKIASELARAIGLPTVSYELGIDWQGNRGVISPNFLKAGEIELAGADLLSLVYGKDNYYYTLENSINALEANNIKLPISWAAPPQITTAAELFAGYLMLDAWICNID